MNESIKLIIIINRKVKSVMQWVPFCLIIILSSSPLFQGKRNSGFRQCFFGNQKHCKLTKLCPAMGYTFRLAARNDIGTRYGLSSASSPSAFKACMILAVSHIA